MAPEFIPDSEIRDAALRHRRDPVAPGARRRCRSVLEFIYKASIIIGQPVLLQN